MNVFKLCWKFQIDDFNFKGDIHVQKNKNEKIGF